jgi:hypothetical protein
MPSLRPKYGEVSCSQRSHDTTKGSNNIHIIKISNEYQIHMITYDKTSPVSSRTKVTTHKSCSCSRSEGYWISLRIWTYNLPPNKPTSINYKMKSTLLATHRYQYEVLRQRLNTRDELGFEMRWCWWRCWWRLVLPWWEDRWWCRWLQFPPPGRKYPRRNRFAGEQNNSCPGSASRQRRFIPKVLSLFFF